MDQNLLFWIMTALLGICLSTIGFLLKELNASVKCSLQSLSKLDRRVARIEGRLGVPLREEDS